MASHTILSSPHVPSCMGHVFGVFRHAVCFCLCSTRWFDALRPHMSQGPGASFNFDRLLFLHLEPHTNWPHCWPYMLRLSISAIVNVLIWHSDDFSNELKLLDHSSSTPWCNRSSPPLIPRYSIWSAQSTAAKAVALNRCARVTVWPPGLYSHLMFSESFHCHRLHEMGKSSVGQAFPLGMHASNDFYSSPG